MNTTELYFTLVTNKEECIMRFDGQKRLMQAIAHYIYTLPLPDAGLHDDWSIVEYIPQLFIDAIEWMRTAEGNDAQFRTMFRTESGYEIPDLLNLGASSFRDRENTIATLQAIVGTFILNDEATAFVNTKIRALCDVQMHYLEQFFRKFLRDVFRNGLYDILSPDLDASFEGQFGYTTFHVGQGTLFNFSRENLGGDILSVEYVCARDDRLGITSGLNDVHCNLDTAISMISEVTSHWPSDTKLQIGALGVMEGSSA